MCQRKQWNFKRRDCVQTHTQIPFQRMNGTHYPVIRFSLRLYCRSLSHTHTHPLCAPVCVASSEASAVGLWGSDKNKNYKFYIQVVVLPLIGVRGKCDTRATFRA